MKKLIVLLISILFLIPSINVKAVQGTKNCYYRLEKSNTVYYTHFAFLGLANSSIPGTIDIESYYYNKSDLNTKHNEFTVTTDGGDYIWNWMNDYGIKFSVYNHLLGIFNRVNDGETSLLDSDNTEACPSIVYKLKKDSSIYYVFCNGYNTELNVNTCSEAINYINNEKKFDGYSISSYGFTSVTGFNNVGASHEGETNINETQDDLKEQEADVCDPTSASYDAIKCLEIQNQLGDINNQASDLPTNPKPMEEEMGDASSVTYGNVEGLNFCDENGVKMTLNIIGYVVFAAKIIVPLLLIIMGTIDFTKALTSSDDKAVKDAFGKLVRRVIAGVIVFFIPTIFNFAFSLIDEMNEQSEFSQCSSCLFTPFNGGCSYTKLGR